MGPRHAKAGYMVLGKNGQTFRLTWKDTFLMTWRGLWPNLGGTQSPAAKDDALGIAGASGQGGDGVAEVLGFGAPCLECALFGNL
jgi:hypothetical protein